MAQLELEPHRDGMLVGCRDGDGTVRVSLMERVGKTVVEERGEERWKW